MRSLGIIYSVLITHTLFYIYDMFVSFISHFDDQEVYYNLQLMQVLKQTNVGHRFALSFSEKLLHVVTRQIHDYGVYAIQYCDCYFLF